MKKEKLYLGKYLISLYLEDDEEIVTVFGSVSELAKFINRPTRIAHSVLNYYLKNSADLFYGYKLYLIDFED